MSFLDRLRTIWLERCIRVLSVDLARARDILGDFEDAYAADCYNSQLCHAIVDQHDRIEYLEAERNQVQAQLSKLLCSTSSS